jgi:molybdenum cofactor biosynthesis protein B
VTGRAAQSTASPSVAEHRAAAPDAVRCAVLTVSDTRTGMTDTSGGLIRKSLTERGHRLITYKIVKDDPEEIRRLIDQWASNPEIQAIISNGGTGIAARDTTYDVVATLLQKRLDGFGELFRMLSYQEIGPAAMLSRAVAGVYHDTVVFVLPGSTNAVSLALEKLILPELSHVVFEIAKQQAQPG